MRQPLGGQWKKCVLVHEGLGGRLAQFCRCSAALHSFIHGPPVLAVDLPELSEAT